MTSTEIEVRSGGALAVGAEQTAWTEQQLAVLRSAGVNEDVTPAELSAFLHECQRTGLDPFTRQIYLIGRRDKKLDRDVYRAQTGIDGYRVIAHRAARRDEVELSYADTVWCGPDGVWREAWLWNNPPLAAKITVYRGDKPFPAVATLGEYAARWPDGNLKDMWKRMPANQLAKCAEALALRKAFPHDLGGIYTAEEMEQADARESHPGPAQITAEPPEAAADPIASTPGQRTKLVMLVRQKRGATSDADRHAVVSELIGREISSFKDLTSAQAHALIEGLGSEPDYIAEEVPEGWTQQQADQLAADFLAEVQAATTDAQRVEIASRIGKAVKAGKITPDDRETLLAAYTGRQPQTAGAAA